MSLVQSFISRGKKVFIHFHDAGEFKEEQHPRAKSGSHPGQFVSKGEEGTAKPKAAPGATVVNPIAKVLKEHGYEKQKGSNTFKHESGHEVEAHAANEGQKWLTGWTHKQSGKTGAGAGALHKHLTEQKAITAGSELLGKKLDLTPPTEKAPAKLSEGFIKSLNETAEKHGMIGKIYDDGSYVAISKPGEPVKKVFKLKPDHSFILAYQLPGQNSKTISTENTGKYGPLSVENALNQVKAEAAVGNAEKEPKISAAVTALISHNGFEKAPDSQQYLDDQIKYKKSGGGTIFIAKENADQPSKISWEYDSAISDVTNAGTGIGSLSEALNEGGKSETEQDPEKALIEKYKLEEVNETPFKTNYVIPYNGGLLELGKANPDNPSWYITDPEDDKQIGGVGYESLNEAFEKLHPRGEGGKFIEKPTDEDIKSLKPQDEDATFSGKAPNQGPTTWKGGDANRWFWGTEQNLQASIVIGTDSDTNKGCWQLWKKDGGRVAAGVGQDGLDAALKKYKIGESAQPEVKHAAGVGTKVSGYLVTSPTEPDRIPSQVYSSLTSEAPEKTNQESSMILDYKGNGYKRINDCMRFMDDCDKIAPEAKVINNWLSKARTTKPLTLLRGIQQHYAEAIKAQIGYAKQHGVPAVIRDRGFISTTTDEQTAVSFAGGNKENVFIIEVPEGSHAASVDNNSEREVLFQQDTRLIATGERDKLTGYWKLRVDQSHFNQQQKAA